jgi:hypothetical protein
MKKVSDAFGVEKIMLMRGFQDRGSEEGLNVVEVAPCPLVEVALPLALSWVDFPRVAEL